MTDFFREVDEEVRRDRAVKFLQRFQIPLIGLAVLVVAATAGWRIYDTWRTNQAETAGGAYEAADQLARDNKSAEAEAAFQKIVDSGPKGYALLARFRVAATTAATDPEAAVKDYDALAADATIDPTLQDIARYRAALLRLDKADPKEMDERLAPLTRTSNPFRNSARELLALAALKANDFTAAGNWLDMIVADPQTPDDLRQRAETDLGIVAANQPASK
ncbi:MAG TPA: tetratricopeptide repeat protein [Beijerinckiaceae bacterium]|nr:tetratricopeptide repeat protein [Beijerinckiaceae bacterium]